MRKSTAGVEVELFRESVAKVKAPVDIDRCARANRIVIGIVLRVESVPAERRTESKVRRDPRALTQIRDGPREKRVDRRGVSELLRSEARSTIRA